eukprot:Cvel_23372.t1-p1 / transcript=Cvel_23372.t1 / gene=Cvel_23372 / organism=Chromera_velia_CCMP2878 / gene_product=hypothetical protein / transcript_product=hypothetical protein / location=Cvel_scaffold2401:48-882(-) / protein_length=135 / sequence_SO=supercontig / SO=protein_coding / is_pseudo=false
MRLSPPTRVEASDKSAGEEDSGEKGGAMKGLLFSSGLHQSMATTAKVDANLRRGCTVPAAVPGQPRPATVKPSSGESRPFVEGETLKENDVLLFDCAPLSVSPPHFKRRCEEVGFEADAFVGGMKLSGSMDRVTC